MNHEESHIQRACVKWFSLQYGNLDGLLFAVPNGGRRNAKEAAIMKAEGVTPGVADLLLLVPSGEYHGLCIEMKTEKGRQSDSQKDWESKVSCMGYAYRVCRGVDDFISVVNNYLNKK